MVDTREEYKKLGLDMSRYSTVINQKLKALGIRKFKDVYVRDRKNIGRPLLHILVSEKDWERIKEELM